MNCEICDSDKFIDAHHYDCKEGKISCETINLCRRCHRTYHDRGIEWFDDQFLDKAVELENKRRLILNNANSKALPLIKREDVVRSDYWNKIHGISKPKKPSRETKEGRQLGFEIIDK